MYYNRKNSQQKSWRMVKKGKQLLFCCSLVFAMGIAGTTVSAQASDSQPEGFSAEELNSFLEIGDAEELARQAKEYVRNEKENKIQDINNHSTQMKNVAIKQEEKDVIENYSQKAVKTITELQDNLD